MKDAKKIAASIRSAIAAANIYSPGAIREAMAHVRSWQEDDPAEQAVVNAFVALMENNVERKERILREAFGTKE